MSSQPGPWTPPTSLGELASDPLNGVADRGVQAAFGRVRTDAPSDEGTPHRPAPKTDRATVDRLLAGGELRRARVVGVRETFRAVAYSDSGTGSWECPVWQLGLEVDGLVERRGCRVAVNPVQPPVKVGDVVQVRCDPQLGIAIVDRIASGWAHEGPADEARATEPADPPPTGYTSEVWEDSVGRRDSVAVLAVLGSAGLIAVVSVFLPSPFTWAGFALALITAACVLPVLALKHGTRLHADETWPTVIAAVTEVSISTVLVRGRNPVALGLRLFPPGGAPVDVRIDDFVPRDAVDLLRPGIALPVRTRTPSGVDAEVRWIPFLIAHARR
ncbi:MAG TPA: hypothetical protein VK507_22110 [Iamia sp.]|nr:hypothetical protein [Iamia sp.]